MMTSTLMNAGGMKAGRMRAGGRLLLAAALLTGLMGGCATTDGATGGMDAADAAPAPSATQGAHHYSQQELDQMLAPIALYPDSLLSQMLMASTYPLEVVQAARWSRAHPEYRGDKAVKAVEQYDWDPSVKSLTAFPRVLETMNQKLEWTENLGDAFLSQQGEVMDTVQKLRRKAYDAGNLKSNTQVRVVVSAGLISIYYADPEVVYVPYYDPTIVFGIWWWPAYPPMFWAPWPGYFVVSGYAWGGAVRISSGFFFGTCDWRHRRVDVVNVRNYYYAPSLRHPRGERRFLNTVPGAWRHNPQHRRGVPYRNTELRREYGGARDMERRNVPRNQAPPSGFGTAPGRGPGQGEQRGQQQPQFEKRQRMQEQPQFKNRQRMQEQPQFKNRQRMQEQPQFQNRQRMQQQPQFQNRQRLREQPMGQTPFPGQGNRGRERREGFGMPQNGGQGGGRHFH